MSSNPYSVGLHNVGSFQVSGRPWLKSYLNTTAGYTFIEFPNVTKSIYIHNDHNGAGKEVTVMFCRPTSSAVLPTSNTLMDSPVTASSEFTISTWVKFASLAVAEQQIVSLLGGNTVELRTVNTNTEIALIVNTVRQSVSQVLNTNDWFNFVIVVKNGENKVFLNGDLILTNAYDPGSNNAIQFSHPTDGVSGQYSTSMLFSKALTNAEVSELYTTEARTVPSSHSQASSLHSVWLFDDATINTSLVPDTPTQIFDRVGNSNLTVTNGPVLFSTGWTIDNAETRHSWVISGQQSVRGNVKTNRILLKHDNNDDMSIFASLTNIPAHLMHELTGPGIDD